MAVKFYDNKSFAEAKQMTNDGVVYFANDKNAILRDGRIMGEENNFKKIIVGGTEHTSGTVTINAETLGLGILLRWKGSVNNVGDLVEKQSTAKIGDVWDVRDTGMNYAWIVEDAVEEGATKVSYKRLELGTTFTSFVWEDTNQGQTQKALEFMSKYSPMRTMNIRGKSCEVYLMIFNQKGYLMTPGEDNNVLVVLDNTISTNPGTSDIDFYTARIVDDNLASVPYKAELTLETLPGTQGVGRWDEFGGKLAMGEATENSQGLMSAADKKKLNGIEEGANNYVLPTASSSVKGGAKIGAGLSMDGETLKANVQASNENNDNKVFIVGTIDANGKVVLNSSTISPTGISGTLSSHANRISAIETTLEWNEGN
ncbi:MAG: hypothetical protein Q4A08_09705 [Bacteroidales bacterium]|nr:hypothetical protein [Bacteroidales bacterium]